ncbi:MAG: hypothetical protein H7308_07895 [Chthonomonadaceae bacterium]|nr:hypothetical protein [Chthonomonadaceae bacterium]
MEEWKKPVFLAIKRIDYAIAMSAGLLAKPPEGHLFCRLRICSCLANTFDKTKNFAAEHIALRRKLLISEHFSREN